MINQDVVQETACRRWRAVSTGPDLAGNVLIVTPGRRSLVARDPVELHPKLASEVVAIDFGARRNTEQISVALRNSAAEIKSEHEMKKYVLIGTGYSVNYRRCR
jgi:hypothetical protein